MAKLALTDIASTQASSIVAVVNANNALIEAAVEKTLSRDGTSPNTMENALDMNSERIINLPIAGSNTEPVRLREFQDGMDALEATVQDIASTTQGYLNTVTTIYDDFDDRYLGQKASDPSVDNDGNVLLVGALYWNTVSNIMRVWTGTVWAGVIETSSGYGIGELADVTLTSTTVGDVLRYDGTVFVNYPESNYQPRDATLDALAGATTSANKLPYFSGVDVVSLADFTPFARTLVDDANASSARVTLGAVNIAGDTLTGKLSTTASTSTEAGLNIPHGTGPSAPVDGDVWTTSSSFSVRINGVSNEVALPNNTITFTNKSINLTNNTLTGTLAQFNAAISDADIQPLNSTLTALAAFNSNGLLAQTASDTFTSRTITAPAAGITISNGNGVSGNPTLALANDLGALENLSSTGFAVRSTTDTWAQRSFSAPSSGFTITNNDGVSGNPTFVLANDLNALESLSSTGLAVRSGSDTWVQRTVTGTSGKITVTNGDGVSGNPTITVGSDIVDETIANTYTAGAKQTFQHDATNSGLNIAPAAGDPSTPSDGDIWYNSTSGVFRKRQGGTTSNLDTTGGGGGGGVTIETVEVDFTSPAREKFFDVSFVGATSGQKVVATPSISMPTGFAEDELEFEPIAVSGHVLVDNFVRLLVFSTRGGLLFGKRNINFILV